MLLWDTLPLNGGQFEAEIMQGNLRMMTIRAGMMRGLSVNGHQAKGRSGAAAGFWAQGPPRHWGQPALQASADLKENRAALQISSKSVQLLKIASESASSRALSAWAGSGHARVEKLKAE